MTKAKKVKRGYKTYVYFVTGPEGKLRMATLSTFRYHSRAKAVEFFKKPWEQLYKQGFRVAKCLIEYAA